MQNRLYAFFIGAVALAAVVGVAGLSLANARVRALDQKVAALEGSLRALGGEVGQVAEVANGAASSTKNLAVDVAATSKVQTAALTSQAAQLKSQEGGLQAAVAAVNPAVVSIVERDSSGAQLASGTGFVVRATGYIMTNRHVVEDTEGTYYASFSGGKEKPLTVIWISRTDDLAVGKIAGSGYPAVTLGDSSTLALGEQVFAVGNALGRFNNTVSVGVVSGLNRTITATDAISGESITLNGVIQTDAAINPGNSGGPVVNRLGKVVGISVATAKGSQSVGFALPISRARAALTAQGI